MKNLLKNYFYYSRQERKGSILLVLLLLGVLLAPKFYTNNIEASGIGSEYYEEVKKWTSQQDTAKVKSASSTLFFFNPNTLPKDSFLLLGISARVAENIINYRSKVGTFQQKEDLKKIYTLSEEHYLRLHPFIKIEKKRRPSIKYSSPSKKKIPNKIAIDINQADQNDWQQLRGIGPAYSARIIKFRNALGGFYSIEQIAQTYGFPDSTFQKIKPFLNASPVLQKLNVNQLDAKGLSRHPYLNWKQANAIINYRTQHGPFNDIEDIKKIKILSLEVIEKIESYLTY